ncbi:MAG TPA: response regulator, partial [Methylomirabilota bacterium]|nr:response regulator [Methylomirabilota bacterium]
LGQAAGQAEITVSDTGIGIRPEFLPFVFDRFRQADGASTRRHGGLGLGLALVRHLVELHGGTVEAESAGEGHGATFRVRLPMSFAPPRADDPPAAVPAPPPATLDALPSLEGLHVLVVDDEADARELIRLILEGRGALVTAVASTQAALAALARARADVLVSDIGLPGDDGYALIRQVRALPPDAGGATPAVALTAYARTEDRTRALLAGFETHVAKPVEPAELVMVVARLAPRA